MVPWEPGNLDPFHQRDDGSDSVGTCGLLPGITGGKSLPANLPDSPKNSLMAGPLYDSG